MINYSAIATLVGDAFTAAGAATVLFARPGYTGSLTARTPAVTTPAGAPVRAFILPASKGTIEAFDNKLEDDALKGKEIRYLKVAACDLTVIPRALDLFTFQGKTWRALGCTPVDPSGGAPLAFGVGVVAL